MCHGDFDIAVFYQLNFALKNFPAVLKISHLPTLAVIVLGLWLPSGQIWAQTEVSILYSQQCAKCHGRSLQKEGAPNLLEIVSHKDPQSLARSINDKHKGPLKLNAKLDSRQIYALIVYMRERLSESQEQDLIKKTTPVDGVFSSSQHAFSLVSLASGWGTFWSMDFLPNHDILITEKSGNLYRFRPKTQKLSEISGVPEVWPRGQGGLLDVAVHPQYKTNQWIYLAYSEEESGMTAIVRGKIVKDVFVKRQNIFTVPQKFYSDRGQHFGTRMVFSEGYLYFGIGDRGSKFQAQDLGRPNGKIHRLHDDGRIPKDNPFLKDKESFPSIWTYGNRNPQGLTLGPDGLLWEAEHGPRGGDELNIIRQGLNYGWPLVSYGINYSGLPFTKEVARADLISPVWHWTPSIAVSNIDFYEGDKFPNWQGNLFAASLVRQELHRLSLVDGKITAQEILLKDQGRIRDVRSHPDGFIYLLLESWGRSQLMQMVPVELAKADEPKPKQPNQSTP